MKDEQKKNTKDWGGSEIVSINSLASYTALSMITWKRYGTKGAHNPQKLAYP